MPTQRPTLDAFTAAHPHDPARAVEAYRAALSHWRASAHPMPQRPPRPVVAMAIGAMVIIALLALAAALGVTVGGCSAPDPSPGARCVEGCADLCAPGRPETPCQMCIDVCEERLP